MKPVSLLCLCSWLFSATTCLPRDGVLESAGRLETQGHFTEAAVLLDHELRKPDLSPKDRQQLEFERDRLERIRKDFPYSEDALFSCLKKSVRDLSRSEYDEWLKQGRFECRQIDGQRLFMASSVPNLFFRYPELYARRLPPKSSADVELAHWETCLAIRRAALAQKQPYVLPKHFIANMSVTADVNAAPNGEIIRAWLPIPRQYPFQNSFRLISAEPAPIHIDDESSPARNVYFEQPARKGKPTAFKLEYEYTGYGVWFAVDPAKVQSIDLDTPRVKPFITEGPHVVFTPEMRELSQQVGGSEPNPYLKAKKFYEWISEHIKYSFALEYSTIRNISDTCLKQGYGDCGQEALLFIALCRLNGIPARWQSGWNTFPGAKSIHDWSEIYVAPYGWIPVDPYMGIYATQYATTLKPEQRREIRDFYFGGLDQYRMAANEAHNQALTPTKRSMRSDDVDFQRGELEWGRHNIYFDNFSYGLAVKEVAPEP